ncbi:hypothetical protein RKG96_28700 [Klebsiella pneumoniae]|nr:hypothetical protein [Klebsiella pneumoniae]
MRTVQSEHDPFLRDFWREESARLYWETDFTEVVESLDGSPRAAAGLRAGAPISASTPWTAI